MRAMYRLSPEQEMRATRKKAENDGYYNLNRYFMTSIILTILRLLCMGTYSTLQVLGL